MLNLPCHVLPVTYLLAEKHAFLGHNAALACNKCFKKFEVNFRATNYSGYNREDWILRSKEQHMNGIEKLNSECTMSGLQSAESKYGLLYSVLHALTDFHSIRFVAIDTMHNLLPGTGKHSFEVRIETELLTKQALVKLEHCIKLFVVPADVGRLPSRISSCHDTFTVNQLKH